jgi:hypothetical protein
VSEVRNAYDVLGAPFPQIKLERRDHFENLDVGGKKLLKLMLRKWGNKA